MKLMGGGKRRERLRHYDVNKRAREVAKLFYRPGVIGLFKILWLSGRGFLDRIGRVENDNEYSRQDSKQN